MTIISLTISQAGSETSSRKNIKLENVRILGKVRPNSIVRTTNKKTLFNKFDITIIKRHRDILQAQFCKRIFGKKHFGKKHFSK